MIKSMYNAGVSTEAQRRQALKKLGGHEGLPVQEFLMATLAKYYETLGHAKDVEDVYRYQGRIAAIEAFLETLAREASNSS